MIKAVVFDCDGLLIDTETPTYEALRGVYREYGAELPLEIYVRCVGSSFDHFNPYHYLEECIQQSVDHTAVKQAMETKREQILSEQCLLPGVEAYLQEAKRLGLMIGLASSSDSEWVKGHLQKHGIVHYFDTIQTSDRVRKVKPDPELYVQALHNLGVTGREAIAFEDSANGLMAAKAAGMNCVIVPNHVTANLTFEQYDLRLNSMEDMPLAEVIGKVESRMLNS